MNQRAMIAAAAASLMSLTFVTVPAKAAEKERVINLSKAKSKKKAKAVQITLKYLDTVIRQCENSVEHYQETLSLAPDNKDAKKNHEEVVKFSEKLRDIRQQKASEQQGKGKGEG